ncbi:MAG: hypothetical protein NVSMB29_08400 [Candidatus Dormibacteria bacterium]
MVGSGRGARPCLREQRSAQGCASPKAEVVQVRHVPNAILSAMRASLSPQTVRALGRLARGATPVLTGAAASPVPRRLLGGAASLLGRALAEDTPARGTVIDARHPMLPSAIRVERSRLRRGEDRGDQTAVTMWFGSGPALPSPGGGPSMLRAALRIGAGALAAGAVAAASAYAARVESAPSRLIDAPPAERRRPD